MQSAEEIQAKLQMQTKRQLEFLIKQIDSTNQTLCNVKQRLAENAEKTVEFIEKINNQEHQSGDPELESPIIENMIGCLVEV